MKRLGSGVLALLIGCFAGAAGASADTSYSIQVRAVPITDKADGMATYRALRDKGYLAYAYRAEIDGRPWLRVAVGAFGSVDEAVAFGRTFAEREDRAYFVTSAPARITPGAGGDFVVTPTALWTREGGEAREMLVFAEPPPKGFEAPGGIRLKLSPDRGAVAFQYGAQVYTARLGQAEAVPLIPGDEEFRGKLLYGFSDEHIYGPVPHWSPSGRFIAFHDFLEFEVRTSLWAARADGSELRTLADNRPEGGQRAVKDFVWHPAEDRIFYVDGYAMGTVSVGGVIRAVDMDGNITTVLEPQGKRQELAGPLRIEDGRLHYRIVQFDENYVDKTYNEATVAIDGL